MNYAVANKGTILIITLWILAIITILAVGIGYRVGIDLKITGYQLYKLKALYIAKGGINKAILELENKQNKDTDFLAESWSSGKDADGNFIFKDVEVGDGNFTVFCDFKETGTEKLKFYGISTEEGRININTATKELLSNLSGLTADIAAAIVDWRDENDIPQPGGAENAYYQSLVPPYSCRNKEFKCIEELLLVKDVTPQIFDKIKNLVTVHSNGKININAADYNVLCALMGEILAYKVVRFRQGADGETGTQDDNFFAAVGTIQATLNNFEPLIPEESAAISNLAATILDVKSSNFRIDITAKVKQGKIKKHITCIIERTPGQPSKIKYWNEQ